MKLVSESLNEFKAGVPQIELKQDFLNWLDTLMEENPDEDWEFIASSLINDEFSDDEELIEHLISNGVNDDVAWDTVEHRTSFMNYGLDIQI